MLLEIIKIHYINVKLVLGFIKIKLTTYQQPLR